jgi:hypothetical protein
MNKDAAQQLLRDCATCRQAFPVLIERNKNGTISEVVFNELEPKYLVWKDTIQDTIRYFPSAGTAIEVCEAVLEQVRTSKMHPDDFVLAVRFALGEVEGCATSCEFLDLNTEVIQGVFAEHELPTLQSPEAAKPKPRRISASSALATTSSALAKTSTFLKSLSPGPFTTKKKLGDSSPTATRASPPATTSVQPPAATSVPLPDSATIAVPEMSTMFDVPTPEKLPPIETVRIFTKEAVDYDSTCNLLSAECPTAIYKNEQGRYRLVVRLDANRFERFSLRVSSVPSGPRWCSRETRFPWSWWRIASCYR